ncbi:RNA 2',3'-cyclic phosphodiesterase [Phycisphaerales bacterium AB-hyl4]|uniref:RNA 2',3'-cyclic phosphodiesterase n=1 Tax=Natronomicrosphaera hydrolytica TaxID=3242702 RepID=A0ABV4U7P2_9BACT
MATLRLFIAVPCTPSPGLRQVLAVLNEHRPALKPVSAEQLHVTLRFLGEQPESHVPAIARAMQQAVADAAVSKVTLPFHGLMALPPGGRRPPRTLCVGFKDAEPLQALSAALDHRLARLDPPIPAPGRPFRAHLTLARVKSPPRRGDDGATRVRDLLAQHASTNLGQLTVETVQLIASQLTPQGPVHRVLDAAPLPSSLDC